MEVCDDLISRQAAIDALGEEPEVWSENDDYELGLNNQWHYDINALKAVSSAQRWIPVSERLPEDEKEVLVTRHFLSDNQLKKNAITESFYVEVASRVDDEWTSYSDEYKIRKHLHKVVAWMPLPEPYKENDNAEIH